MFSLFEEDSQYVQLRRTQKMNEEVKSYPMLEREIRNPVIKERFEDRMERYQRENRKENYKDYEMNYSGAFESDVGGL